MNTFTKSLEEMTNFTNTENGDLAHKSTLDANLDLFALGGSYRNRDTNDKIKLFKKAFNEDKILALKNLFYLRDIRDGVGEREFFRTCLRWLAKFYPSIVEKNIENIPLFGRWDDLWTSLSENATDNLYKSMIQIIKKQILEDGEAIYNKKEKAIVSLLGKWLPSINASSKETRAIAQKIRKDLGFTNKEYRKICTILRKQINIIENTLREKNYSAIEYNKLPSLAGLKYRKAFARNDYDKYSAFIENSKTKVNAAVATPFDIMKLIPFERFSFESKLTDTEIQTIEKYWQNLPDLYEGKKEVALCVCDTSGSMYDGRSIQAAVGLSLYIAERGKGAFHNTFLTFSSKPELVKIKGENIVEKVQNIIDADWGMTTNLEAVFNLIYKAVKQKKVKLEDIPTRLYIFSDMEFDKACIDEDEQMTYLESLKKEWEKQGLKFPQIIFWNLNARHNCIPAIGEGFSYISGYSPNMVKTVLSGKTGRELMLEKLNSERYDCIMI